MINKLTYLGVFLLGGAVRMSRSGKPELDAVILVTAFLALWRSGFLFGGNDLRN